MYAGEKEGLQPRREWMGKRILSLTQVLKNTAYDEKEMQMNQGEGGGSYVNLKGWELTEEKVIWNPFTLKSARQNHRALICCAVNQNGNHHK